MPNVFTGIPFAPVIEPNHEGAVLTGSMYEKLKAGEFNRVKTIIGFDSNEAQSIMQGIHNFVDVH